jgi:hypothetical protein
MSRALNPGVGLLSCLLLAGCQSASELIYEPKASDPLDGYSGSLAQAGINTEMDSSRCSPRTRT